MRIVLPFPRALTTVLVASLATFFPACGGSGGSGGAEPPGVAPGPGGGGPGGDGGATEPDAGAVTAAAIDALLSGDQDLRGLRDRFEQARDLDPEQVEARLMAGLLDFAVVAQDELRAGGAGNDLMQRAGLVNGAVAGQLWDLDYEVENHGQGTFKDTTPNADELRGYFESTLRPAIDDLIKVLESVPADWEYVIPSARGGRLLERLAPGQAIDLRADYGDAQALIALGHGLAGAVDLVSAFDLDELDFNDFDYGDNPTLSPLETIHSGYDDLGR